jgi:peptidoglycan/xylan/chitin deacetylase (PgdA/CDA1 family)
MKRAVPGSSPLGDAANLISFLIVVSLCLAVTIFAALRITHLDPRALFARPGNEVGAPPSAYQRLALIATPATGQPLELHADGSPEVVRRGSPSRPMVALTFDAGMTPAMLQEVDRGTVKRFVNDSVLTELRQLQVPTTFFLSGLWIERYPDVARGIGTDPLFEVGSNSYSGQAFRAYCSQLNNIDLARAGDDLERNQTLLGGIAAQPTRYFRFPGGCYDAASLAAVRPAGLQVVQYDVVSGDGTTTEPAAIIAHTVANARAGSIVVLHITGGDAAPATGRALPEIVRQLRARGFQLVRVSDLLGPKS